MQLPFASSLSIARLINDELRIATILFVQWRIVPSTYAMIVALFDEFVTTSTRSSPEQTWKTSPQHDIWFCFVSDGIVTFLKSASNFDAWNVSIATVCQPTATSFSPANLFLPRLMLSKYHNFHLSNGFIHISVNFPQNHCQLRSLQDQRQFVSITGNLPHRGDLCRSAISMVDANFMFLHVQHCNAWDFLSVCPYQCQSWRLKHRSCLQWQSLSVWLPEVVMWGDDEDNVVITPMRIAL